MVIITRGPIHIIAEIDEIRPIQIIARDDATADVAEDIAAGDARNLKLAGQLCRSARRRRKTAFSAT